MWLTALQYFHQAATLGSMRLASDKLGVAVSSISRQVAHLEQEFGLELFERGRRSIKLTAAGELALEYYRDQLADREALLSRLRDLKQNRIGLVQLAVGEGLLGGAFASFVERYQRANPGISLSLLSGNTADITRLVLEDEVHMGVILRVSTEPKIRNRLSVAQPLMVMCAPTHRVAALHSLTLSQLREHALCLPPRGFSIRPVLSDAERREHVRLEPRLTTSSLLTMREVAKLGTMVTVLPRMSAVSELQEGTLVSRPLLAQEPEHCRVTLIHRVGRRLDGAPLRVLGLLESQLKSWSEEIR